MHSLRERLRGFLDGLPRERVGLVLNTGELVELPNISAEPENSFLVPAASILPYLEAAVATFHTHPTGTVDPSPMDMHGFALWPDLKHWIVAPAGERCYGVTETGALVVEEAA